MENDTGDAYLYNVTAAGIVEHEHGKSNHNIQIICYIEKEENAKRSKSINMGNFKSTSRNATKQLKI